MLLSFCASSPRAASASAGFVNALTKSVRNCPGWCERFCATDNGTSIELSSESPVETIPVIDKGRVSEEPSLCPTWIVLPIFSASGYLAANAAPITHSLVPSLNHRPSTFHQGWVMLTPVLKVVPSGTGTPCSYHVPTAVAVPPASGTDAGTSRNGVKPSMLWRQKIVFSLPRSRSFRYAPSSTGR